MQLHNEMGLNYSKEDGSSTLGIKEMKVELKDGKICPSSLESLITFHLIISHIVFVLS